VAKAEGVEVPGSALNTATARPDGSILLAFRRRILFLAVAGQVSLMVVV
jgi:hypothetical protein